MRHFNVMGMSCASCSARVEKAVSSVEGVTSCSVSLLTNSMGVEGSAKIEDIISAVYNAGYEAELKDDGKSCEVSGKEQEDALEDKETPLLLRRLCVSLIFLAILMYFSMGHMMWNCPIPAIFDNNHIAMGLLQMLLTIIIMVINQRFFISGYKSLWHRSPNMDTLVALGASAAFIYSTVMLFAMTNAFVKGDADAVLAYMHEFYFESAAMILTLITLGKMLEARSKGKTTNALKELMKLAPKRATILSDGVEIEVLIEQVKSGDIFVVRPGESIPVDGVVVDGYSAINESTLTGESIPVDKTVGSTVSAGTLNQSGYIKCEATRVGEDTTLSQIIQLVNDVATTKAPIAKVADKVSGVFVPVVICIAIITIVVWLITGQPSGFALARGISVLVISCPCALGLATPVAIMVGNGIGAKNGILFKTAVSLENTGSAQIVVLDKTGTITKGEPSVTDITPMEGIKVEELLSIAYSLENKSEHPLARAVVRRAEEEGLELINVEDFETMVGNGVKGKLQGTCIAGGSFSYISEQVTVSEEIIKQTEQLSMEGKTVLLFIRDSKLCGIIAVADTIKEDSSKAISQMQHMGLHVVMLTGDNERTAKAIGVKVGVDEVIAGVLPDGKESAIRKMQQKGKVIMVGDGINDAPALTSADIGIAIGAGSDVAIDAADVVLMKNSLLDVAAAIRLSRATLGNIHENLFWAFIYNIIGIPLAAGVFISILGWQLNPMYGAAAMSLSSFCVVTNALRLNLLKIYDAKKDYKVKKKIQNVSKKEKDIMTKTIIIDGMMCGHCEAHVKKALEKVEGVKEAKVSHADGKAVVTLDKDVADDILKSVVEEQDYKVVEIK